MRWGALSWTFSGGQPGNQSRCLHLERPVSGPAAPPPGGGSLGVQGTKPGGRTLVGFSPFGAPRTHCCPFLRHFHQGQGTVTWQIFLSMVFDAPPIHPHPPPAWESGSVLVTFSPLPSAPGQAPALRPLLPSCQSSHPPSFCSHHRRGLPTSLISVSNICVRSTSPGPIRAQHCPGWVWRE